jgi:hypothetical protein
MRFGGARLSGAVDEFDIPWSVADLGRFNP